jgi:hypothetical protein
MKQKRIREREREKKASGRRVMADATFNGARGREM